jgi:hypothetical protein
VGDESEGKVIGDGESIGFVAGHGFKGKVSFFI